MQSNKTTTTTTSSQFVSQPTMHSTHTTVNRVDLPVQVIEKPVAIHEEIRRERVEEIQPIVNVEKIHTEVHQVTQPLFDKEVRAVHIERRELQAEVLPEIRNAGVGMRAATEQSTVNYQNTNTVVIEKPAIYNQVDRIQVIQEIQPVLYKETVVPTVIQETKEIFQKVVEGPVYTQQTLASRDISKPQVASGYVMTKEASAIGTHTNVDLPIQIVEKPATLHEEIRNERVEEIQPVINVEKIKTEIHQVTQPLFDKEIKPVIFEKAMLEREILPDVHLPGRGVSTRGDISTIEERQSATVIIEKNAIYNEVERRQVIEEIQPVIYKETIVPTVIQETKQIYQKIVEGPVYVQEVLPARDISSTHSYTSGYSGSQQSFVRETILPVSSVPLQGATYSGSHLPSTTITETVQTTTTTTAQDQINRPHHAL